MPQILDELGDQIVPTDGSAPEDLTFWGRPVALVPLDRITKWSTESTDGFHERIRLEIAVQDGDKLAGSYRKAVLNQVDPSKRGDEEDE